MSWGFEILNDDGIVSTMTTIDELDDDKGSCNYPLRSRNKVHRQCEKQQEENPRQNLRNIAVQKTPASKTQKEVRDYFKVT